MARTIIADFARYGHQLRGPWGSRSPIWPASGSCSIIGAGGGDTNPSRF
jgi:hypothetical protein